MAHYSQRLRGLLVSVTALVLLASPAFAGEQDHSSSASSSAQRSAPPPDFLIGRPHVVIAARASWFMPRANSDFYDQVTNDLTLEKSDFNSGAFAFEGGYRATDRVDLSFGVDWSGMSQPSEDRNEEELLPNGSRVPIQQTTELHQTNFTASAKFALIPRGHAVSRLAWIPNAFVPYVGAGAGMGKFSVRQNGDFVDFVDHHIFTDTFSSEGWAPIVHVFGGTDIQMYKRLMLTIEGRYSWSHADLDADFVGFEPIDLGGLHLGAGIQFVF
jgi:opacity protein-like surface antigen